MPGSKVNATNVEAFGRVIISVSNSVWPQALAILTAIILMIIVLRKFWKQTHPTGALRTESALVLEFCSGKKSEFVKLLSLNGFPDDFEFEANEYIKGIFVEGIWAPRLKFQWPSLTVVNTVTKHTLSVEQSCKLSWIKARRMRSVLGKPFVCLPIILKGNVGQRVHIKIDCNEKARLQNFPSCPEAFELTEFGRAPQREGARAQSAV